MVGEAEGLLMEIFEGQVVVQQYGVQSAISDRGIPRLGQPRENSCISTQRQIFGPGRITINATTPEIS